MMNAAVENVTKHELLMILDKVKLQNIQMLRGNLGYYCSWWLDQSHFSVKNQRNW